MTQTTEKFLKEALSLPATERAEFAERLLLSLDANEVDIEVETAWQIEIDKRLSEIQSGKAVCIPWEDVRSKLKGIDGVAH